MSDLNRLHNAFTYISDDGSKVSSVDNVLRSTSVDKVLKDVIILNDVIGSDHKPVSFNLGCGFPLRKLNVAARGCVHRCCKVVMVLRLFTMNLILIACYSMLIFLRKT